MYDDQIIWTASGAVLPDLPEAPVLPVWCPYCYGAHLPTQCHLFQAAAQQLATLSDDVAVEQAMSGD